MTLDKNTKKFNKLQVDIDSLKQSNKILEKSHKFLSEKIQEFKDNGRLEDYEIKFIKNQINFHKKLATLKKTYSNSKKDLTNKSKEKIEKTYSKYENSAISMYELDYLEGQIKSKQFNLSDTLPFGKESIRDIVENNIDIKFWPDSIIQKGIFNDFFDDFAYEYLSDLEQNYSNQDIYKKHLDTSKGLHGTRNSILNIIKKVLIKNYKLYENFNNKLEINIGGKKYLFYTRDIRLEILETNELPIENEDNKKEIKTLKPKELKIKRWHQNDIYGIELKENILLSNYIEKNGLPPNFLKVFNILLKKHFNGQKIIVDNKKNQITDKIITDKKEEIINNFIVFLQFLLKIESYGGRNISNKNGSGAEGYFQFKTNNNSTGYEMLINKSFVEVNKGTWEKFRKLLKKKKQNKLNEDEEKTLENKGVTALNIRYKSTSIETAIKRAKIFYGKKQPKWLKIIPMNKDGKIIDPNFDIKEYGYEEQMILWLIDLFERKENVEGNKIRQYLANILFGSQFDARELYTQVHHTQISSTSKLVQDQVRDILSKLKIIKL